MERQIPPAHGILAWVPELDTEADPSSLIEAAQWPASQALITDGQQWQAWVHDEQEGWRVRERFNSTAATQTVEMADQDSVPLPIIEFIEFLRRALLCWNQRRQPEYAARYLASFARAASERLLREHLSYIQNIQYGLDRELGYRLDDPSRVAQLAAAMSVLEQLRIQLFGVQGMCLVTTPSEYLFPAWSSYPFDSIVPREALELIAGWFRKFWITEYSSISGQGKSSKNKKSLFLQDQSLMTFCRTFWAELSGESYDWEGFFPDTTETDEQRISAGITALSRRISTEHEWNLVDLNAGAGTALLAVARLLPPEVGTVRLVAYTANPLGWQIMRLRLEALLASEAWGRNYTAVTLHLRNIFQGVAMAGPMEGTYWLVGSSRPPLGVDARLALTENPDDDAYRGQGTKIHNLDLAASRYLESIRQTLSENPLGVAGIYVSARWAGDDPWHEAREQLVQSGLSLWIDPATPGPRPKDRRLPWGEVALWLSMDSTTANKPSGYEPLTPRAETGYSLLPAASAPGYFDWPSLTDLALRPPLNGPIERRHSMLIDIDRDRLEERLHDYFSDLSDAEVAARWPGLMKSTKSFDAVATRKRLKATTGFSPRHIMRYAFRPFDERYLYTHKIRPLFNEPAVELFAHAENGNEFLVASEGTDRLEVGVPAWYSLLPCDYDFFAGRSGHFPVWTFAERLRRRHSDAAPSRTPKKAALPARIANLSEASRDYLKRLGYTADPDQDPDLARLLWHHALAVLYTPAYRQQHQEALRHGWPRIPLPSWQDTTPPIEAREHLESSAAMGKQIADLLIGKASPIDVHLEPIAIFTVNGKPIDPQKADVAARTINADWGIRAKGNAVRPRPGRITQRDYYAKEAHILVEMANQASSLFHLSSKPGHWLDIFGDHVVDIYLNKQSCWVGIPGKAWQYTIGGHPVLSKWLSYRDKKILNRSLTFVDVRAFTQIIIILVRLLSLEPNPTINDNNS